MELPRRKGEDVFLPDGTFTATLERLRGFETVRELRIGIAYAFDFRTRMLPYWYADKRMAPCSVRTLADVLNAAGFEHIRVVLQQWTPNFKPSEAELDGKPLDILLVSAMQVHAEPAYKLIRDACTLGENRPLILAGGPKAIYEPTDYLEFGPRPGVGADCVSTGESYVLLALLERLLQEQSAEETIRETYHRVRLAGGLTDIHGLTYMAPYSTPANPVAVNTGIQHLLRDLDEMPLPDAGYRLLEPPHKGTKLQPHPLPVDQVRKKSMIASLITTQGCKFNCSYCPIPAANQRTWRHKSPQRFADEVQHIYETFGIRNFFGTDDNFFNNRDTVVALMEELSTRKTTDGKILGSKIRFATEATEFDVHKNLDILPLCRKGGLRAIWFGLEDLTAEVVNKGQTVNKTEQLFAYMNEIGIMPMAMMIHGDHQPLISKRGDMSGVMNQARFLFKHGAVSYQCTYLGPAVGTRSFEEALNSGAMYKSVGRDPIPQAYYDGNHIVASEHDKPWWRQLNLVWAYGTFYNPVNMVRTLGGMVFGKDSVSPKRFLYQLVGNGGLLLTIPRLGYWAWKMRRGPIERITSAPRARIPLENAGSREPMNWTILHPLPEAHGLTPGSFNGSGDQKGVRLPVVTAT